jgi:hypothetical protein
LALTKNCAQHRSLEISPSSVDSIVTNLRHM